MSGSEAPVLLAYDGSPSAAAAIAAAGRLAKGRRAIVCHVWARLSRPIFHTDPTTLPGVLRDAAKEIDQIELEAAERTSAEGVRLAEAAGFSAEPLCVAERGHTWRALLDAADDVSASMVVAGAQNQSAIRRTMLGSVSTGLVHHADLPVLIVPTDTADGPPYGPLLLCYDHSEASVRAIQAASELLAPVEALVLHVWESWRSHVWALASVSGSVTGMAEELDELAAEQSTELSVRGAAAATAVGFEATGLSESAEVAIWRTVLAAADAHRPAAIVLGSRGLGGLSAALGSVSNGVVHHANTPSSSCLRRPTRIRQRRKRNEPSPRCLRNKARRDA